MADKNKVNKKKSPEDIRKEMAVPPIPQQQRPPRNRGNRRRDRLRLEVTPVQGMAFVDVIGRELRKIGSDHPSFKDMYACYFAIKSQVDKFTGKQQKTQTPASGGVTIGEFADAQ